MDHTAPQPPAQEAVPPAGEAPLAPDVQLIAADVGGTHARLARVRLHPHAAPQILALRRYLGADYPSLAAILDDFRRGDGAGLDHAVVAIAGVVDGDTLVNSNLPWPVTLAATRVDAGLARLDVVNDFEAVARAIAHVDTAALEPLNGIAASAPRWPALVLGPGTGLGVALRLADGSVLASEAGHAALAPGNALELQVLARLQQRWPHVDNERVFSGPGLLNLYQALCDIDAVTPRWHSPAQLVEAAAHDALAARTLEVFCAWLGSLCGDLAVAFGARAVYLTGGVAGHLAVPLARSAFGARFRAKGVLSGMLAEVPVWRVAHGELGVLGAAAAARSD